MIEQQAVVEDEADKLWFRLRVLVLDLQSRVEGHSGTMGFGFASKSWRSLITAVQEKPICFCVVKTRRVPRASERITTYAEEEDYRKTKLFCSRVSLSPQHSISKEGTHYRNEKRGEPKHCKNTQRGGWTSQDHTVVFAKVMLQIRCLP